MASPFFFVDKKEKDLIDKLKEAEYFTKLDLHNSYNNIQIKDGDQWKAAFKTNKGLFELMVMFFGLSNSPATFQFFMDDIFANYLEEEWVVIYMNDILIFSPDLETHKK
uniref:Reverse transcriptase domain-containing protein n=1 Tax=Moniliophthora roreri TaxID=221103 RepID=A0A0W0GFP3_MONRR